MAIYKEVEDPRLRYLREFQSQRLRKTYADIAEMRGCEKACEFFFTRLYTTEDTSERDEAFVKIYSMAKRYLGGDVVKSMTKLIELQRLSIALDDRILEVLEEMGAPVEFDMETYERAYRLSDNYDERVLQIELLEYTLRLVHRISHRFGIGMILHGLRTAALAMGDTRMVDFLMEGYEAFKRMKDINVLAVPMVEREIQRLDRIYADQLQEHAERDAT